jgi:chromosome segregation ATPase
MATAAVFSGRPPLVGRTAAPPPTASDEAELDVQQLLDGPLAMPDGAGGLGAGGGFAPHPASAGASSGQFGVAGGGLADANRAQNVALKVQLAAVERELAQTRHALDLALVKAHNWAGMKHRVTLAKPLNPAPLRQWAAAAAGAAAAPALGRDDGNAAFVIASLQSQLRDSQVQRANLQSAVEEHAERLRESQAAVDKAKQQLAAATATAGRRASDAASGNVLGGDEAQRAALVAHLQAQTHFLHAEVERLEAALAEHRDRDSTTTVQRGVQAARELQVRDAKIAQLANQLTSLRAKLSPLQKAALESAREGQVSPMDLLTRIGQLEADLRAASQAREAALTEKYALGKQVRKLEERVRDAKSSASDVATSAVGEVMHSAQQVARLRDALATAQRERENLQSALEIRRLRDASRRLASVECQTFTAPVCESTVQTDATARPRSDAFCQVDSDGAGGVVFPALGLLPPSGAGARARAHASGASGSPSADAPTANDAFSLAHSLELKCAEADTLRARLEELALQAERSGLALKQTRDALGAEVEVRRGLEAESERTKAQVRTLQQTVSQLHVLLRDRDAALGAADERAQAALNDSVKLAHERRNWERQLAANAHDLEQVLAQQATASQQVAQAASENEALREEVSRLLQREAQLSHALRAKDGELAEILASYQMCVQENDATVQSAKSVERECNNLKAGVTMRDERINELQREVAQLHQREEQLTTDLQSCDYENGLLHRKVVQAESLAQQLQAGVGELEQQLAAQRRVTGEFERAQAELHKQLIVKDNEVVLLRRRCDVVEHENTMLQTASGVERHKLRELEEANARLTVSGLMAQIVGAGPSSTSTSQQSQQRGDASPAAASAAAAAARESSRARQSLEDLAQRNGLLARQLEVKDGAVAQLQQQIADERRNVELLRAALAEKAVQLEQNTRAMEELKRLVAEQARTLAQHASAVGMSDSDA